jgi:AAA domain
MQGSSRKDRDPNFTGNPFIDKLPQMLTQDEFFDKFEQLPPYDKEQRKASNEARFGFLLNVLLRIVPLTRHYDLYTNIWEMLRYGYFDRNPEDPAFWRKWQVKMTALKEDLRNWKLPRLRHMGKPLLVVSPFDAAVFGLSGCGKSTSVGRILRMFPQVIPHPRFGIRQVVWLEAETTSQASTKDQLLTIMRAFDDCLGTSYALRFGKGEEYELLAHTINICYVNALGLLAADELQNLTVFKSRGADAILQFLLRLTNTSKTPIIAIGTYEAERMMKKFQLKRRWWRAGSPGWRPLERPKEWNVFMAGVWPFQFTRQVTELSKQIDDRLYEESQGIPDYAVRLYVMTQKLLIARNDGGTKPEIITPALISQVAREYLGPAYQVLQALRSRDEDLIESLVDVELPPLSQCVKKQTSTEGPDSSQKEHDTEKEANLHASDGAAQKQTIPNADSDRQKSGSLTCELPAVVGDGLKQPTVAYDRLKEAGYIRSATEFWE